MKVEYQEFIKTRIFILADEVTSIAQTNNSTKKQIGEVRIGKEQTTDTAQDGGKPLQTG